MNKFRVGEKVRIKPEYMCKQLIVSGMKPYIGKIVTISKIYNFSDGDTVYQLENGEGFSWKGSSFDKLQQKIIDNE